MGLCAIDDGGISTLTSNIVICGALGMTGVDFGRVNVAIINQFYDCVRPSLSSIPLYMGCGNDLLEGWPGEDCLITKHGFP